MDVTQQHPTPAEFRFAHSIVDCDTVLRTFAACEWDCLNDDGKTWIAIIIREATSRYREALAAIQTAVIEGHVCDDVAWFDRFTTLHDFIDGVLNPSLPAAVADLFDGKRP